MRRVLRRSRAVFGLPRHVLCCGACAGLRGKPAHGLLKHGGVCACAYGETCLAMWLAVRINAVLDIRINAVLLSR
jgi:hypothetical protein